MGDVLTESMFKLADASMSSVPSDYANVNTLLSAYSLYTKDGSRITSEYTTDSATNKTVQHLYLNGDKNSEGQIFRVSVCNMEVFYARLYDCKGCKC